MERYLLFRDIPKSTVELLSKSSCHSCGHVWWPLRFWSTLQSSQIFQWWWRPAALKSHQNTLAWRETMKMKVHFVWFSTLVTQTGSLIPTHHIMISWKNCPNYKFGSHVYCKSKRKLERTRRRSKWVVISGQFAEMRFQKCRNKGEQGFVTVLRKKLHS